MVEIYTADTCVWCRRMKKYLDLRGVDFRCINADEPQNIQKLRELTGQRAVPVTVIGNKAIVGYDTQAVDIALREII